MLLECVRDVQRSQLLLSQEKESTLQSLRALDCWEGTAGSFGLQGPAGFAGAAASVEKETGAGL